MLEELHELGGASRATATGIAEDVTQPAALSDAPRRDDSSGDVYDRADHLAVWEEFANGSPRIDAA